MVTGAFFVPFNGPVHKIDLLGLLGVLVPIVGHGLDPAFFSRILHHVQQFILVLMKHVHDQVGIFTQDAAQGFRKLFIAGRGVSGGA